MSIDALFCERLREERKRCGFTQTEIADRVGIRREMWARYEGGVEPGASVLVGAMNAGLDVAYVLTGNRGPSTLPMDEELLLDHYRLASKPVRKAALGVLMSGSATAPARPSTVQQDFNGATIGQVVKKSDLRHQSFSVGGFKGEDLPKSSPVSKGRRDKS